MQGVRAFLSLTRSSFFALQKTFTGRMFWGLALLGKLVNIKFVVLKHLRRLLTCKGVSERFLRLSRFYKAVFRLAGLKGCLLSALRLYDVLGCSCHGIEICNLYLS